jgi:HSP20 family molecular chaperone IbpA
VTVELPGLNKQDVDISVKEGMLTISGELITTPESSGPDDFAEYEVMDDNAQEQLLDDFLDGGNNGKDKKDGNDSKGRFVLRERQSGKFKRCLRLPSWVNVDSIKATMNEGVLKLVFEKPGPETPDAAERKVNIL